MNSPLHRIFVQTDERSSPEELGRIAQRPPLLRHVQRAGGLFQDDHVQIEVSHSGNWKDVHT